MAEEKQEDTAAAPGWAGAKFTTGPTMRHILVMTITGATGLMAIFLVDLADMYFLSLLGEVEVAAAIGYAGSILFFTTSVGIGLAIAATALVSRSLGEGDEDKARRMATNAMLFTLALASALAVVTWLLIPALLTLLGAGGRAFELASGYLFILVPTMPVIAAGICSSGILRAVGDAQRAMHVTLAGAVVNGILDPILIFGLDLGVNGAAIASAASRFAVLGVGAYGLMVHHQLVTRTNLATFVRDVPAVAQIAVLAILTNVATPVGNAFITAAIADFGDSAVAGWAIIGRIIPVAFGALFALSGAIGPILGQNLGAGHFDRVRQAMTDAVTFATGYTVLAWLVLALLQGQIAAAFNATGTAADLIWLFCVWLAPGFIFFGALFVSNAAFNNLGAPHYSTMFNWGRAVVGNVPLVTLGGHLFGAPGVLVGFSLSGILFGCAALLACYRRIDAIAQGRERARSRLPLAARRLIGWPFNVWRSR